MTVEKIRRAYIFYSATTLHLYINNVVKCPAGLRFRKTNFKKCLLVTPTVQFSLEQKRLSQNRKEIKVL